MEEKLGGRFDSEGVIAVPNPVEVHLQDLLLGEAAVDFVTENGFLDLAVGSSRVDLQACKLEYSIVSPK